ncbi:MAG: hypothetical protein J5I90_00765 [Caldilineales bacterium]|nr:hypothetical protein [Caldilineales bacterium]
MQVYVNEKYIERRAKMGRRTSLVGLGILAVGMLASFSPGIITGWIESGNPLASSPIVQWLYNGGWSIVAMGCLLIGFILGQMGNQNMRRFLRSPRPDEVVAKALKGFDSRNRLYAWSTPGDLVFAGPSGVFTLTTNDAAGVVTVDGDKVRQPFSIRRLLTLGQNSAGRPVHEAQSAAASLSKWLGDGAEEGQMEVTPIVVFVNDNVQLDVHNASVPMVHHKQLKQHLRNQLRGSGPSKDVIAAVMERLDTEAQRRGVQPEQ